MLVLVGSNRGDYLTSSSTPLSRALDGHPDASTLAVLQAYFPMLAPQERNYLDERATKLHVVQRSGAAYCCQ